MEFMVEIDGIYASSKVSGKSGLTHDVESMIQAFPEAMPFYAPEGKRYSFINPSSELEVNRMKNYRLFVIDGDDRIPALRFTLRTSIAGYTVPMFL